MWHLLLGTEGLVDGSWFPSLILLCSVIWQRAPEAVATLAPELSSLPEFPSGVCRALRLFMGSHRCLLASFLSCVSALWTL